MAYKVGRCLLKDLLTQNKMSQSDLASLMDVTVQQINKYVLGGQKMHIETAKNISAILKCSMEDLYEWIEE